MEEEKAQGSSSEGRADKALPKADGEEQTVAVEDPENQP